MLGVGIRAARQLGFVQSRGVVGVACGSRSLDNAALPVACVVGVGRTVARQHIAVYMVRVRGWYFIHRYGGTNVRINGIFSRTELSLTVNLKAELTQRQICF